jgi:hypothetical protein
MPGAAVELIRYNAETRRFEVGPLALDVLRATTTPVAVVAVCGRARQVRKPFGTLGGSFRVSTGSSEGS